MGNSATKKDAPLVDPGNRANLLKDLKMWSDDKGHHPIFCADDVGLMRAVQMAELFKDSKDFVDMKLKHDPLAIEVAFASLVKQEMGHDSDVREVLDDYIARVKHDEKKKKVLLHLIEQNFHRKLNLEFEDWDPSDWREQPYFIYDINNRALIQVAEAVNELWKDLSLKCSSDVLDNPVLYSMIGLSHGFIMPGGRFRETYYWDTYWVVRGLLISGMVDTVRGILDNFFSMIDRFGFIPNGTRVYYLSRTQPPYMLSMMRKYLEVTKDTNYMVKNLLKLDREMMYYLKYRLVKYKWPENGKTYSVFRYFANISGPRPESYREDVELAEKLCGKNSTEDEKEELYLHLKAAAESGWDFSSRWFINEQGTNEGSLANAKTAFILPVDLNALMYKNFNTLIMFHRIAAKDNYKPQAQSSQMSKESMNNILNLIIDKKTAPKWEVYHLQMAEFYEHEANKLLDAMNELFWDPEEQMWFDIDTIHNVRRRYFFASNLYPLWAEAYEVSRKHTVSSCAVNYLRRSGVLRHRGGIPATTNRNSHEQWDFNAWPPLQHMIVSGLNKTDDLEAKKVAFGIAKRYTLSVIASCPPKRTDDSEDDDDDETVDPMQRCQFYEKYNPMKVGMPGGGGEYEVQAGFGWTNGVLIDFITTYGDDIVESTTFDPEVAAEREARITGIMRKKGQWSYLRTPMEPNDKRASKKSSERSSNEMPDRSSKRSSNEMPQKSPKRSVKEMAKKSSQRSSKEMPEESSKRSLKEMTKKSSQRSSKEMPEKSPKRSLKEMAKKSSQRSAKEMPEKSSKKSSNEMPQKSPKRSLKEIPKKSSKRSSKEMPQKSPKRSLKEMTKKSSQRSSKEMPEKSPKRSLKEMTKKSSQCSSKEMPKKSSKKSSNEMAKKSSQRSAKEMPEKSSKKSSNEMPQKSPKRSSNESSKRSL